MIPIKFLIRRTRHAIHDEQHVNYSDHEILDVINAGLRFIRRTIADIQPEILLNEFTGILQAGEDTIKLKKPPMMIVELTAGDKLISCTEAYANKKIFRNREKIFGSKTPICSKYEIKTFVERPLQETNLQHVKNKFPRHDGHARYFYRIGWQNLKLFPKPKFETAWTLKVINDVEDLKFDDTTPLINEFDDFLTEFCIMRLSIDNNYDMTQEQQILANIYQQISRVLSPPPPAAHVRGYW